MGMPGYLHIFVLDRAPDGRTAGSKVSYQVSYTTPGSAFVRAYDPEYLREFLITKVALDDAAVDRILTQLRTTGRANIADVEFSEQEAAALGMEQIPTES